MNSFVFFVFVTCMQLGCRHKCQLDKYYMLVSSSIRNLIIVSTKTGVQSFTICSIFEEKSSHPVGSDIKRSDALNGRTKKKNSIRDSYPLMCGKLCLNGFYYFKHEGHNHCYFIQKNVFQLP